MSQSIEELRYDILFYHGAYPLWKYLESALDIDIRSVCTRVTKEEPQLVRADSSPLAVRIMNDHEKTRLVSPLTHREDITFLLNSVHTVYNSIKNLAKVGTEYVLSYYSFQLTDKCCLELVDIRTGERVTNLELGVVTV